MQFPFERRKSQFLGEIHKPIIPVIIKGPKRRVKIFMLLDSGADLSLIPYSVGTAIGLTAEMENRNEVQGIGEGTVPYILSEVNLIVGNVEFPARIGWALIEEVPFILGRLDFFQKFSIEFREFEKDYFRRGLAQPAGRLPNSSDQNLVRGFFRQVAAGTD